MQLPKIAKVAITNKNTKRKTSSNNKNSYQGKNNSIIAIVLIIQPIHEFGKYKIIIPSLFSAYVPKPIAINSSK